MGGGGAGWMASRLSVDDLQHSKRSAVQCVPAPVDSFNSTPRTRTLISLACSHWGCGGGGGIGGPADDGGAAIAAAAAACLWLWWVGRGTSDALGALGLAAVVEGLACVCGGVGFRFDCRGLSVQHLSRSIHQITILHNPIDHQHVPAQINRLID